MCESFHAHKIKLCFMPLTPVQPFKDAHYFQQWIALGSCHHADCRCNF